MQRSGQRDVTGQASAATGPRLRRIKGRDVARLSERLHAIPIYGYAPATGRAGRQNARSANALALRDRREEKARTSL